MEKTFKVPKMHCESCNWLIGENVKEVAGVLQVKADFRSKTVKVKFGPPADERQVVAAIEKEGGYKVVE